MSGILGIWNLDGRPVDEAGLRDKIVVHLDAHSDLWCALAIASKIEDPSLVAPHISCSTGSWPACRKFPTPCLASGKGPKLG